MPDDWAEVHGGQPQRRVAADPDGCEPLLRRAEAGRAVFVTDARARAPKAYWGA